MTAPGGTLLGARYRIDDRAAPDAPVPGVALRRYRAHDEKLDRPVLAWIAETAEGVPDLPGGERESLLSLARVLAGVHHAAFLPVLDVVVEDERLAVVLGAPVAAGGSAAPSARDAARTALAVGEAIEAAAAAGLAPVRLEAPEVPAGSGSPSLDPVAVFLPDSDGLEPPAPAALLARLLDTLLDDAPADDPLVDVLDDLSVRWSTDEAGGLSAMLAEIRAALDDPAPSAARAAVPPLPAAPFIEDEPTELLAPVASQAVTPSTAAPPVVARALPPAVSPGRSVVRRARPMVPMSIAVPTAAAVVAVGLAAVALFATGDPPVDQVTQPPGATSTPGATADTGPPAVAPAAGQVTVGLAAQEDSNVRVTVDGVVQFNGVLRAGERQSHEGTRRIDVWTDKGKTIEIAINGEDLGPYSPAMGHPDWNRIDFGFWPGWAQ
ncbi:MAG: RodZ domain-containing protein [Dehalococcoidia bacterium]